MGIGGIGTPRQCRGLGAILGCQGASGDVRGVLGLGGL